MSKYKTGITRNSIKNIFKNSEPLVEAVYNAIDANSTQIKIDIDVNMDTSSDLFGSFDILIKDNGDGIPISDHEFEKCFCTYQDSPKKGKPGLYGKRGQGRYKYLKLIDNKLNHLNIYTRTENTIYQIKYIIENNSLGFEVNVCPDEKIKQLFGAKDKTVIEFKDIDKTIFEFIKDSQHEPERDLNSLIANIQELLAVHIADALISRKVQILINNTPLEIDQYIREAEDEKNYTIDKEKFDVKYIIWNEKIKLKKSKHILYFDEHHSHLSTTPSGSHKDYLGDTSLGHTILITSTYFNSLDEMYFTQKVARTSDDVLNELQAHVITKFRNMQLKIWNSNTHTTAKDYQKLVSELKGDQYDEIVDDVYHAMTLPFIYNSRLNPNDKIKQIIGRLLKILIQTSPSSYLDNLDYIAGIDETSSDIFDYVKSNIDIIDIVMQKEKYVRYLDILNHFDDMVNGKGKKIVQERTQLHKVLEKNLWIIREDYENMLPNDYMSDKSFKTIFQEMGLQIYNDPALNETLSKITTKKELNKIPDLFIPIIDTDKKIIHIIEIKKPNVKITDKIISEIKSKYVNILNKLHNSYNEKYEIRAYAISSEKTADVSSVIGSIEKDGYEIEVVLWKELIETAKRIYNQKLNTIDLKIQQSKWTDFETLISESSLKDK